MKKMVYKTPEVQIIGIKMHGMLMGGSIGEKTTDAVEMSSGSFGARTNSSIWDDEVEE